MATNDESSAGAKPAVISSGVSWAESAASAKAWAVVAVAFFGVIGLALFLFEQHSRQRASEIDAQLAQNAARLGQEVELKYKNYRTVVDNVTRILSTAGSAAASSRQSALLAAQTATGDTATRQRTLEARAREAKRRQDKPRAPAQASGAAFVAYSDAESAAGAAQTRATDANDAFQRRASGLIKAQQEFDGATGRVERAQQHLDELAASPQTAIAATPPATSPANEPTSDAGAAAGTAVDAGVAPDRPSAPNGASGDAGRVEAKRELELALESRAQKQNTLDQARANFADAQSAQSAAQDEADRTSSAAEAAFAAWLAPKPDLAAAPSPSPPSPSWVAPNAAPKATAPADPVRDYLKGLTAVVLPSQVPLLDACQAQGASDVDSVKLCVARQIAEVSNGVEGLEMVRCSSSGSVPTLSDDGRYLLIPPSNADAAAPANSGAGHPAPLPPACGRVKIRSLLSGSDPASRQAMAGSGDIAFDGVFLLRRDGTALYSLNLGSNLRLSALPGFEPRLADASGVLSKVALGTGKYRAFLQPVRVRLAAPGKEAEPSSREHSDLLVCGLTLEDRLDKASYELTLPSYLWAVLLLGAGLLSLPLAKLWLLGPKTNFTTFDVTALGTSALLLTLLGVVVVLGFLAHNRLGARADRQLTQVGVELSERLKSEIGKAASQLSSFNQSPETGNVRGVLADQADGKASGAQRAACGDAKGAFVDGVLFSDDGRSRSVCERTNVELNAGSNWDLVFMMDPDGNERVKFARGRHVSTVVSLKDREYFKRAIKNDTGCIGADDRACLSFGVPDLVRSVTSGSIVLIVAEPVCAGTTICQPEDQPIGVAALEASMTELQHLSFPLGVQAAVIDENGRIMLHSNNDAHHEQNLFGEVGDPSELRATLASHVPGTITLNYLGQPSRMHIEPLTLPGTGWSVATITPTSIVDVATTDMVLAAVFGYGSLVAAAVLLACCLLVARQARDWLWRRDLKNYEHDHESSVSLRPHAAHSRAYAKLGLFAIRAGSALSVVTILAAPMVPTTVGLMAVVLVWIGVARRLPRSGGEPAPERPQLDDDWPAPPRSSRQAEPSYSERLPLTYLLCIVGLAQAFVMAPATVLFAGAYDHVVDDLVRAEHDHYASVFRRHPECLAAIKRVEATAEPALHCSAVFGSGEERTNDHEASSAAWQLLRARLLSPLPYLADLLPRVGSSDTENSGRLYRDETVGQSTPSPVEFASLREPLKLRLALTANLSGDTVLSTPLPLLLLGSDYHWLNLVILLLISGAALAGSYAVGFFSLRRLFFLNVLWRWQTRRQKTPDALLAELAAKPEIRRRVVVRFPSELVRQALKASPTCHELSASDADAPSTSNPPGASFLLLDRFDESLADATAVARFAKLTTGNRSIVVLTESDPIRRAPPALQRAWASALERFDFVELQLDPRRAHAPERQKLSDSEDECLTAAIIARIWLDSDDEERRLLAQLAINGYVAPHPANEPTLRALAARGLLDAETLTIQSPELERYARQAIPPETRAAWADADRYTAWTALRVPLSTGVAALFAAMMVAKPELGAASAIVPTLTAGLPSVLKILTQMVAPKNS